MKNYIILIVTTFVLILVSYWLISAYANLGEEQTKVSLKTEMAEIKAMDLNDFLLETPDVLVLFVNNDISEEFSQELLLFLRENNLLSEMVYLNTSTVEIVEEEKITDIFNVNYEKLANEATLIVINDFETVASFSLLETDYTMRDLKIFLLRWGYLDD